MFAIIAVLLMQAVPTAAGTVVGTPTAPGVSVLLDGKRQQLESRVVGRSPDTVTVIYGRPSPTVAITIGDGTDGLIPMTLPTLGYDQVLALRDSLTGQITVYPDVVDHKSPTVVVKAQASSADAYRIGSPSLPSDATVTGGAPTPR